MFESSGGGMTVVCFAATTIVFIVVMLLFAFRRYMEYRETLALAEKGLIQPQRSRGNDSSTLRWGIVITAVGLALCVGLYPLGYVTGRFGFGEQLPFRFGPWMLMGLIPTFFGLGLILIYVLTREVRTTPPAADTNTPKPRE